MNPYRTAWGVAALMLGILLLSPNISAPIPPAAPTHTLQIPAPLDAKLTSAIRWLGNTWILSEDTLAAVRDPFLWGAAAAATPTKAEAKSTGPIRPRISVTILSRYRLQSTAVGRTAMLRGPDGKLLIVRVGDQLEGQAVSQILHDAVIFGQGESAQTLRIE